MKFDIAQVNRLGNRQSNQDRFTVIERDEGLLAVLADGMGGRVRGEVAAQAVINSAKVESQANPGTIKDIPLFLDGIVQKAHRTINRFSKTNGLHYKPGTTGVLCYFADGKVTIAHVGDSRCYHFRQGEMLFRTLDHSFVQEMIGSGTLTPGEAAVHPKRNQITRCIGCQNEAPVIDISEPIELEKNDVIMLCSDGLWGALPEQQMSKILRNHKIDKVTEKLAEEAESKSYPMSDNISLIVVGYKGDEENSTESVKDVDESSKYELPFGIDGAIDHIKKMIHKYEEEITGKK